MGEMRKFIEIIPRERGLDQFHFYENMLHSNIDSDDYEIYSSKISLEMKLLS